MSPGIYFHSLLAHGGWSEGVKASGRNRTINRQKLRREQLEAELADPLGLRHTIFSGFLNLPQQRQDTPGVSSAWGARNSRIFIRHSWPGDDHLDGRTLILCLQNVSAQAHPLVFIWPEQESPGRLMDLLSQEMFATTGNSVVLTIRPYQVLWLKPVFQRNDPQTNADFRD